MIEFDPSKNLEMSQEALGTAWHDVAEALVLRSDAAIKPLTHELPPTSEGGRPYQFSVQLPHSFAQEVLLEDDDTPQSARASYVMEHRLDDDPAYPETYEAVVVSWSHLLGQSNVKAEHSMMINLVRQPEGERYHAETFVEYAQLRDGVWRRVSPGGYDYSDNGALERASSEWLEEVMSDLEAGSGTMMLEDVERLHRVAEYIREQAP